MRIEIPDDIAAQCDVADPREALELLAIAIYKAKGIHGSLAGKILGISEFEFHALLARRGETVNYGADDLASDIEDNDL
jgi:predicted HTH domain antitoxin